MSSLLAPTSLLAASAIAGSGVALAATRREQKFGETLSTRSVIAAGVGLGVLALATIESAVRFAVWLVLPTRDLTASAPVQLLADGIQRLTRVSDESALPLHAAWLVLGLLMLAGVLGLRQASSASLPNPPQRALKRATYLQAGFVGEFALLVATQTLFGRAVGITTLFGLDESYAPLIQSVATLFSFCVLVAVSFHVYRAAQVHGAAGALESTSLKPIAMTAEQHWSRLRDAGVRAGLVPRPVEPADDSPIRWVSFVAREQHLPVSWQPMNLAA